MKIKTHKVLLPEKGMRNVNKSQKRFFLLSSLCFLLTIAISTTYFNILNDKFKNKIYEYMEEYTDKNANLIKAKIEDDMNSIKILASYIGDCSFDDIDATLNSLNKVTAIGHFKRISIAYNNGECYTSDGKIINIKDMDYYKNGMKGKTSISKTMIDPLDGSTVNLYTTPIYIEHKIQGVLIGVEETSVLTKMIMSIHLYDDSFTVILDKNGEIALQTDVKKTEQYLKGLGRKFINIENDKRVMLEYTSKSNKITYLVTYAPLHINDWYTASFVPSSHASKESHEFNLLSSIAVFFIVFFVLILILYNTHTRKKSRKEKEKLLFNDVIAGGYNFNWFQIYASDYKVKLSNDVWMIAINIAGFRLYNHMYGYPKGDQLLAIIGEQLRLHTFLHRWARKENDCFVAIIKKEEQGTIIHELGVLIEDIKEAVYQKTQQSDVVIHIGVSEWKEDENIYSAIDKAVFSVKNCTSKNLITFYQQGMDAIVLEEKELEANMEHALLNEEFKVYIQPKVDIRTGKIVAGEALIRWLDPLHGLISPGRFIPLFEKNGFLEKVDFYTYGVVCKYLKKWEALGMDEICISFNVSPTYILKKEFVKKLENVIKSYDVCPKQLEAEILESSFANNTEHLVSIIQNLHAFGLRIAMDDFGSGYSSLNMLKELPIDTLKIDQGFFVKEEKYKQKSEKIVALIIEMAKQLQMEIIVEGIETQEQLDSIKQNGCHIVQGFYFYKPMPIDEFEDLLKQEKTYE